LSTKVQSLHYDWDFTHASKGWPPTVIVTPRRLRLTLRLYLGLKSHEVRSEESDFPFFPRIISSGP